MEPGTNVLHGLTHPFCFPQTILLLGIRRLGTVLVGVPLCWCGYHCVVGGYYYAGGGYHYVGGVGGVLVTFPVL